MKYVTVYSSLFGNDPMSHCNFTKHTEILFPQIKVESNHRNSIPWDRHLSSWFSLESSMCITASKVDMEKNPLRIAS